ncbi:YlmC/YmxH family sporulation protein [Lottiidibacillus patelloidae]|uniref:YlmC/YmxH family sporulation protein n=1 Tax=Lottiidibacillus patelloidae TaxID=2670334 RepID=A0A263BYG6_9BACI|nr:YlmC/YmxH family sporulation protein [Lottiidibacillus patelloidae]OZM58622.1 YlmC/YmxH family sporulation protein [Lottiidibacillus patelloidae]
MRLSQLGGKEIIDLKNGERLGVLGETDLEIDDRTGHIKALLIPVPRVFGFKKDKEEVKIYWKHIKKIGTDMIIIDDTNR